MRFVGSGVTSPPTNGGNGGGSSGQCTGAAADRPGNACQSGNNKQRWLRAGPSGPVRSPTSGRGSGGHRNPPSARARSARSIHRNG